MLLHCLMHSVQDSRQALHSACVSSCFLHSFSHSVQASSATFANAGVSGDPWDARFCKAPHSASIWLTPLAQLAMALSP